MKMDSEMEKIEKELAAKQGAFDKANALTREIIRNCAKAITLLHNGGGPDTKAAAAHIKSAQDSAQKLKSMHGFEYIAIQGYQELAEAMIFYEIKKGGEVLSPSEFGFGTEAYLLGLMDVVGELKREVLISIREKRAQQAKEYLSIMEDIYDSTRGLRFAEAVLPNFRRKQDVARIQLESAGSDLVDK